MALRMSPALTNFIAQTGSWKEALDNGSIKIYTGAQPATPNLAATGTLLATLTASSGTKTNETKAVGVVTLSVGATTGDTVTTFTLAGVEIKGGTTSWNASLAQTATDVATAINRCPSNKMVVASTTGASGAITLTARPGFGATLNATALAVGVGGNMVATVTSTTFGSATGGGVAGVAAANGLKMDYNAAAGMMTKDASQTWSGTAVGVGTQTAGWFRYYGSIADADALDSSAVYLRLDGAIATSGADMNMSSTSITLGATQTLSTFEFTVPAA